MTSILVTYVCILNNNINSFDFHFLQTLPVDCFIYNAEIINPDMICGLVSCFVPFAVISLQGTLRIKTTMSSSKFGPGIMVGGFGFNLLYMLDSPFAKNFSLFCLAFKSVKEVTCMCRKMRRLNFTVDRFVIDSSIMASKLADTLGLRERKFNPLDHRVT
jgi:hypothetical protein